MKIDFITGGEKRRVLRTMKDFFGIEKMNYLMFSVGKEKIRGYSGHLSKEEILQLSELTRIEGIGLYLMKRGEGLRLSFDATQILKPLIKKSVFKMNKEHFEQWIKGEDFEAKSERGILIMEYEGDYYGCGKSNGEKIFNQVPKERRIKPNRKV